MKATPILGLFVALALAGCGKKTPCSIARAKIATDARAAKATKVTVTPPPAPVAPIPLPAAMNTEAELVQTGASDNATEARVLHDLMTAEATRSAAFEKALPDRLEVIAMGIESSDAKTAKDKLRALLAEHATANAALARQLAQTREMNLVLKDRHQHLVEGKQLSAPALEQTSKQVAQADALDKTIEAAANENAKDALAFATLEADLTAVTAACSKK